MKKLSVLLASACVLTAFASTDASADNKPVGPAVNPAVLSPGAAGSIFVNWTWAKGVIKVPTNIATGSLTGLSCADIAVTVVSQDQNPAPPGGLFMSPKWTHHVRATGTWATGACTFAVTVVPNSNFAISVGGAATGSTPLKCYYLAVITTTPQQGWFKVPVGGTKEVDFIATGVACQNPPG